MDLHHLLKWRDLDDERIREALRSITYSMQGVEIVKFLREIFDVIMQLFCEDRDNVDALRARLRRASADAADAHAARVARPAAQSWMATLLKMRAHIFVKTNRAPCRVSFGTRIEVRSPTEVPVPKYRGPVGISGTC